MSDKVILEIPKDDLEEVIHLIRHSLCLEPTSNSVWTLLMNFCEKNSEIKYDGIEEDMLFYTLKGEVNWSEHLEFFKNLRKWKSQTKHLSNPSEILSNEYYKNILNMGPSILPLIFKDLEQNGGEWFEALETMTNVNPVIDEHIGIYMDMKNDWLEWARTFKYI